MLLYTTGPRLCFFKPVTRVLGCLTKILCLLVPSYLTLVNKKMFLSNSTQSCCFFLHSLTFSMYALPGLNKECRRQCGGKVEVMKRR